MNLITNASDALGEAGGTITLRTAVTGVPERVRLSDGTIAIMDVGRVVFVSVIDYNGTPTDTDDDVEAQNRVTLSSLPPDEHGPVADRRLT